MISRFIFFFFDGFEHLDHTFLVVDDIDALEHLGVFAATCARERSAEREAADALDMQVIRDDGKREENAPIFLTTS